MLKPFVVVAATCLAAVFSVPTNAAAAEAVKSAANAALRGLKKADDAIVHVAKTGVDGATRGVDKAGEAVTHVIKKVGLPTDTPPPPKSTGNTQ
jgi:hypothetical protein